MSKWMPDQLRSKIGSMGALAFAVFALTSSSFAGQFALELDRKSLDLSPQREASLREFLGRVDAALPPSLKSAFRKPIRIRFSKLGDKGFGPPACPGSAENGAPSVNYRYGFESLTMPWEKRHLVELHEGFLEEIGRGPEGATTYGCGHRNLYRLALATAIHEIAHHYDALVPPTADGAPARASLVSSSPEFLALRHLSQSPEHLSPRSPDPYEFKNERENFAVNMEFFTLDPEYACRRPSVYGFFSRHFGFSPGVSCQPNAVVPVSSYSAKGWSLVRLDPKRIYEIHYLLAEPGTDVASKFGHAMFRIVMCSPTRQEVGPDCLRDVNDHIVVSYRANIRGLTIDQMSGLTGKYPSQLFLLKFMDVITEYTVGESRSVASYPMKLDRGQVATFVGQVNEEFWQYENRYYFVTNNCAVESFNLLRAAFWDQPIQMATKNLTPNGLKKALLRFGLLNERPVRSSGAIGRHYFPSVRVQLQAAFERLSRIGLPAEIRDPGQLMSLSATERGKLMDDLLAKRPDQRREILASFLAIEIQCQTRAFNAIEKKIAVFLVEKKDMAVVKLQDGLLPWHLASGGYGIPLRAEMPSAEKVQALTAELQAYMDASWTNFKPLLAAEIAEYTGAAELVLRIIPELKSAK